MDYLTKIYKERCKAEFGSLGFKPYRNYFYRVINDMFQSFHLHKSVIWFGGVAIEFIATPLCAGRSIKKDLCGSTHLKMFEGDYSWFPCDKNSVSDVNYHIEIIMEYMKKYLIPYFHECENSKGAYYATYDFQNKNYRQGVFHADYYLFCMALKAELYDRALEHLIARKKHIENAYKVNTASWGYDPAYEDKINKKLEEVDYQMKMISERNFEYIRNFIDENESIALSNLGIKRR